MNGIRKKVATGFLLSGMILAIELKAQPEFEKRAVYIEFAGTGSTNKAPVYPGVVNDSNWSKCISKNKIKSITYPFDGLSSAYLKRIAYVSFQDSILESNLSDVRNMSGVAKVYRLPVIEKFTQPNDKYLKSSWFYSALRFPEAWQMSDGSGVKIAIIDDAFKTDHEDLTANLWVNPNEIPADAIDNDNNGYVDDIHGWDLADNDGDVKLPVTYTSIYTSNHGTMVTGVAASAFNNLKGIPGVGFRAKWMGVKCKADFDINNTFISYSTDPMQGIAYAVQAGADIINLSFGYQDTGISPIHKALLDYADSLGVLVVAAAGNDNNNLSSPSFSVYPAAYSKVISVASISQNYLKSVHSNYGSRAGVDVAAPGYCLFTTGMDNTAPYIIGQGTSLSSPLVAGLLGLVKSKHPTYSSAQLRSCLENAAEKNSVADPLSDQLGHGIINAELAVACRKAPSSWFTNYLYKSWVCKGDTMSYLYLHDTDYTYRFNFGDDSNWHTPGMNGRIIHAFVDTGCYNVTLRIFDSLNHVVNEKTLANFTRVVSCGPKYLTNTNWFFGRAVGLHFTSSGPVPAFDYPLWAEGSSGVLNSFTGRHLNSFYNRFSSEYITALPSDFNQATAISGFIQEGGSIYKAYSQNILSFKHPSDTTITFGLFMDHEAHPTSGKHNARYGWFKSDGSAYGLFSIPPMPGSIVCADSSAYIGGGFAAAPMDSSKGWWVFAHGKPDDTHADYPTSVIIYKATYLTSSPGVKLEYHGYHNYGKLADVNHMRLKVSPNGKYLAVHNYHYLSNRIYLFEINRLNGGLVLLDSSDFFTIFFLLFFARQSFYLWNERF